jgi:hypothetical protein
MEETLEITYLKPLILQARILRLWNIKWLAQGHKSWTAVSIRPNLVKDEKVSSFPFEM